MPLDLLPLDLHRSRPSSRFTGPKNTRAASLGEHLAQAVTRWTGSTAAFSTSVVFVVFWAAVGPLFRWSDTWQLVMNTASSIVTFLMVFLIQRSQNKDTLAVHLKLNELITAMEGASKRIVSVEDLSETELQRLKERYQKLVNDVVAEQASRETA
jgi:low affinity Fe/Cu permease